MFKWPRFRFSILSLLLAMTLAAVSVSHWLTSLELQHRRWEIEDLKEQVRVRNHRLGILTVDDPSQVHVIRTDYKIENVGKRRLGPRSYWWNIHLPQSPKYEVRWACGDIGFIPHNLATVSSKGVLLDNHGEILQAECAIEFLRKSDTWELHVTFDDNSHSWPLVGAEAAWIDETVTQLYAAGEKHSPGSITESFPADSPVVLLLQGNSAKRAGIVVWLQPEPKK